MEKVPESVKEVLRRKKKGEVQHRFGIAIEPGSSGKGIFDKIMVECEQAGKKKGFRYVLSYATNHVSHHMLKRHNFKHIASIDAKEFVWKGFKPFQLVDEKSRYPGLYWK